MNEFLLFFGPVLLVFLIGFFIWKRLVTYQRKSMPGIRKKKRLYRMINHWKKLGYNYNKRLKLLRSKGYDKNVANILLGEAEYMIGKDHNQSVEP